MILEVFSNFSDSMILYLRARYLQGEAAHTRNLPESCAVLCYCMVWAQDNVNVYKLLTAVIFLTLAYLLIAAVHS